MRVESSSQRHEANMVGVIPVCLDGLASNDKEKGNDVTNVENKRKHMTT